jgi:hypothetical protein
MSGELAYVKAAADILKKRGKVFIGYISAELEPYSAQQRPDISFVPDKGPNAGRVFFVELRLFDRAQLPRHLPDRLRAHRAFAIEGSDADYAGFAFATNAPLERGTIKSLAEGGIRYLGPVDSAGMLAQKIAQWASESGDQPVE